MRISELRLKGLGPFVSDTTIRFPKGSRDDLADVYLLVGQNGCGKTTALHALAALSAPSAHQTVTRVVRRWSAVPKGDDYPFIIARSFDGRSLVALPLNDRSDSNEQQRIGKIAKGNGAPNLAHAGTGTFFFAPNDSGWRNFNERILNQHVNKPLEWATFSYAGARTVAETRVSSISELADGPLDGALGFETTSDTQRLAQWIANQDVYRHRAVDAGDSKRANDIRESVSRIESAVMEIIGSDFAFHLSSRDLDVRAKLNGSVLDLGLLPEGVKSIVSWIGDLLMRLDRLEWELDVPVLRREFLLLLDEIDIHLHPAWQRKVLPVVQKLFPKAQIIASTHSPFVVASLADGAVIELRLDKQGRSSAQPPTQAPLHLSYSSTLRSLFGITSDFPVETEEQFTKLYAARDLVLKNKSDALAEAEFRRIAEKLRTDGGEEVAQLVQFELNQFERNRKSAQ